MGQVKINDLTLRAIVGFNNEERTYPQDISISISLAVDLSSIIESDSLDDSVNYRSIGKLLQRIAVEERSFSLERLTCRLLLETFHADPRIDAVDITVHKIGALRYAHSASVHMTLSRSELAKVAPLCH